VTTSEGRARLAISIGAIAVFAWGFGPLLVRGIDASAPTIVFWRLWMATPVMVVAAYLTGGRVSLPLLKIVFVPTLCKGVNDHQAGARNDGADGQGVEAQRPRR